MSPELNQNPPVLIKRKKKLRDKKPTPGAKITDFTNPPYGYINSYPNIAMNDTYYSFANYSLPAEPMSLPIYPATTYQLNPISYNGNFIPKPKPEPSEYTSLPVVNGDYTEETGQRRFSDPGLPNDSDSSCNSAESQVIQKLTSQISFLKESNRKLNREVTELRMELNVLKQQHSRHYERDYEPGMISDMIREIRDAARVREDALLAKVKHMVEEKQFSMSQLHIATEKNRNHDRLSKLEEQVKNLNLNTSRSEDNVSIPSTSDDRQVLEFEREAVLLRRELQEARVKREESDQKYLQLDKKLSNILRPKQSSHSETSDDGSKASTDTLSVTTQSSIVSHSPHRTILSGPVTNL